MTALTTSLVASAESVATTTLSMYSVESYTYWASVPVTSATFSI